MGKLSTASITVVDAAMSTFPPALATTFTSTGAHLRHGYLTYSTAHTFSTTNQTHDNHDSKKKKKTVNLAKSFINIPHRYGGGGDELGLFVSQPSSI